MALKTAWDGRPEVRQKEGEASWTVMIFMGAESIAGNAPLTGAAREDLAEIEKIRGGGPHGLDIFVQVNDQQGAVRRHYGAAPDGTDRHVEQSFAPEQLEYRGGRALSDFIETSLARVGHRRRDNSMLILWGHAYEFAFGRSLTAGGVVEALDFAEIANVLESLQGRMHDEYRERDHDQEKDPPTLDIIGFDACDVATVEMAYEFRKYAKYLIGSQIGIPIPGWPYHQILDRLKYPIGELMSPPEFGSYVVRRFCEAYDASTPVSLTLLNLKHAERLKELTEGLAVELSIAMGHDEVRARTWSLFFESQTEAGKPFVDAADLCLNLLGSKTFPLLSLRARDLGNFLCSSRPVPTVGHRDPDGWPLVAEHGRNAGELVRLNGLSLYAPHVAPPDNPGVIRRLYEEFVFAQQTRWSQLVHDLAELH